MRSFVYHTAVLPGTHSGELFSLFLVGIGMLENLPSKCHVMYFCRRALIPGLVVQCTMALMYVTFQPNCLRLPISSRSKLLILLPYRRC